MLVFLYDWGCLLFLIIFDCKVLFFFVFVGMFMVGLGWLVDLNCVMIEEFERLNGIGRIIVKSIVEVWIVLGGFLSIEDLKGILGIGWNFIDVNKDFFCCLFILFVLRWEMRGFLKGKM